MASSERRYGHHPVDQAHQDLVDPAAIVAADHADDDAERHAEQRAHDGHRERAAGAPHHTAQVVAAELVGAGQELRADGASSV